MIASLGMYDRPETMAANDRLWAAIQKNSQDQGLPAPAALTRGEGAYWPAWEDPDLVLSQTCGYPFRARLYGRVTLIGTPDYGLPGCPPGHYCSVFVARADDGRDLAALAQGRLAFNEAMSQSGWAAPAQHLLDLGLRPNPTLRSGSHRASAAAVAEGQADLAALDAVTWALMRRHDSWTEGLREVTRTAATPGLPLISRRGADRQVFFDAVDDAIAALSPEDRRTLHLRGLVPIPESAYLAVPTPPQPGQFGAQI